MLSLVVADGRIRELRKRFVLGASLSLVLHVGLVTLLLATATPPGVVRSFGGIDLARALGPWPDEDVVTVDVVDPASLAPAGSDDPESVRVTQGPARPTRPRPRARVAAAPAPGGGRAAEAPAAPAAGVPPAEPVPSIGVGRTGIVADDSERMAFRAQLRRHLHAAWRANEVYLRIDPEHKLEGSLFTTAVTVRLRPDGSIARTTLAESSSMPVLDKEALEALGRMEPLPPLPRQMLDAEGGWTVLCKFYLDVGMFRFAADIRRAIAERWRPSKAFLVAGDRDRRTVVRLLVTKDGALTEATVVNPAGIDFLDANALSVVSPGMRLPPPPPAFMKQAGPAQVFVAFLHQAGDVRVLKPREDVEEE